MNEHIKDYCEKFIESKENPHFAVFIKGEWGTGKTYFINNLIRKYNKDNTENVSGIDTAQIIKISLFGVSSFDDIDIKIYQAIHPILSSEGMKIAGAVARTALKLGTSIDFNKDGKSDASLTIGDFPLFKGKKVKNISKKLIIVDDLERAILNTCDIFGYFSEIIIESTTKVIFIGNENKISENDEKKRKEYFQIKEKTIGIEFEIETDKKNAIIKFISLLPFQKKEFFEKKTLEISETLKCNNLRTIWQSLYNLTLVIDFIDDEIEDNDKELIFEIFLVLYIQKNLEEIHKDDNISSILVGYFEYQKSYKDYQKLLDEKKKQNTYFLPRFLKHIPLLDAWKKLIFDGFYNKEWLLSIYKTEKNSIGKEKKEISNLFKLIGNWRNLKKEEFEPLIKNVFNEFVLGKYLHPGEILLFANYMIIFSKWELIPNTTTSIIEMINTLLDSKEEKIIPVSDWGMIEIGYGGYAFNSNIQEINTLKRKLQQLNKKIINIHAKENFQKEIDLISKDLDGFIKNIIHANGNNKYYKQPILSFIEIQDFYKKLQDLDISECGRIIYALSERYGKSYGNEPFTQEYSPDFENVKKLRDLFKKNIKIPTYDPQILFEKDIVKELDELVEYFERHIETTSSLPQTGQGCP